MSSILIVVYSHLYFDLYIYIYIYIYIHTHTHTDRHTLYTEVRSGSRNFQDLKSLSSQDNNNNWQKKYDPRDSDMFFFVCV